MRNLIAENLVKMTDMIKDGRKSPSFVMLHHFCVHRLACENVEMQVTDSLTCVNAAVRYNAEAVLESKLL